MAGLGEETVNLEKLGKGLRREVATNPKKAALLGLAVIVAVYFWIPLVWGWIGKTTRTRLRRDGAAPDGAATGSAAAAAAEPPAKPAKPDRPSWQQIIHWMHNDPQTMTAPSLTKTRDPFEPPKTEVAEKKPIEPTKPKPPTVTPRRRAWC